MKKLVTSVKQKFFNYRSVSKKKPTDLIVKKCTNFKQRKKMLNCRSVSKKCFRTDPSGLVVKKLTDLKQKKFNYKSVSLFLYRSRGKKMLTDLKEKCSNCRSVSNFFPTDLD